MFDDDTFWKSGLTAKMGFSSFGSLGKVTSPGKLKRTVNTMKEVVDGKMVTTKTTNVQKADGSEKIIEEKLDENGNRISHRAYEIDKKKGWKTGVD